MHQCINYLRFLSYLRRWIRSLADCHKSNKKRAYDLYHDLEDNWAEDANSFFCEGKTCSIPSASTFGISSIKVGTDCCGIEVPIIALKNAGIPFIQNLSCDSDEQVLNTIKANHDPEIAYNDLKQRGASDVPAVDLYVAGFPCQPFSCTGKQQGLDDELG